MKGYHLKLIFCLLFVLFLVTPGAASAMPVLDTSEHGLLPAPSGLGPVEVSSSTCPLAPPPTEYEVEIRGNKGVYVQEDTPAKNMHFDRHLRVGRTPEFGYLYWTLVGFPPIAEADGGGLPDGAEITGAKLKLWKESGPAGNVEVFALSTGFDDTSVTWTTKPTLSSVQKKTVSVPESSGWVYLDIPMFTLNDSVRFHQGVHLALCPLWTDVSRDIVFSRDDDPSHPAALVISYLGAAPEPTPPPPEPPAADTRPCELTWTVTPERPRVGESVTVTATATDDQAMWYVSIRRGALELAVSEATAGERTLTASHTETAVLPSLTFTIVADDLGAPPPVGSPIITVPVVGSGTAPEVTVTAEWLDVEEVIPERYRLIRGDGQRVRITATASDPDGIRMLTISLSGAPLDFTFDGDTSVSRTVEWVNDEPSRTRFYYSASAQDEERNYTHADGESFDIVQPTGILLMSTAAPGFHNPSNSRLSWERMCQTFGDGECWWVKDWGWKSWYALIWYHAGFKEIAKKGECFGMSTLAAEIYQSRIAAVDLEDVSCAAYLSYDNTFTKEIVEARQGGQLGEEVAFPRYNQRLFTTLSERLGWIERDLANDEPGVLGIREGDGGHAVVPWMSRHMTDGTTRLYIYDSNREQGILEAITEAPTGNPSFDFHDRWRYPYVEVGSAGWSYQWDDDEVWNDTLAYFTYEQACGDMGQENSLGVNRFAPTVTDHDIPSVLDYMFAPIAGDADVYIEDEDGNITGIYEGEIREDIPDSMAIIPMMDGPFAEHELYMLPIDKKLKFHVVGKGEGEYVIGMLGGGSVYSILDKALSEGVEDTITIEPSDEAVGHKMRIKPGKGDSAFTVGIGHMYEGVVEALDSDHIGREYLMEEVSATEESDFSVFVEEGGDTFVVESYRDDITFDAVTRSTESADYVDPNTDPGYIPSSVQEDITVERGRRAEITPENWATEDERGELHTLNKGAKGEGGGFPLIPVIIGLVVIAAGVTVGVLFGKGILGKKATKVTKVQKGKKVTKAKKETKAKKATKSKRGRRTKA